MKSMVGSVSLNHEHESTRYPSRELFCRQAMHAFIPAASVLLRDKQTDRMRDNKLTCRGQSVIPITCNAPETCNSTKRPLKQGETSPILSRRAACAIPLRSSGAHGRRATLNHSHGHLVFPTVKLEAKERWPGSHVFLEMLREFLETLGMRSLENRFPHASMRAIELTAMNFFPVSMPATSLIIACCFQRHPTVFSTKKALLTLRQLFLRMQIFGAPEALSDRDAKSRPVMSSPRLSFILWTPPLAPIFWQSRLVDRPRSTWIQIL